MLTRIRVRRDFRLFVRCLSDKPSDSDGKASESKPVTKDNAKPSDSASEKIQELLKSMLTAQRKMSDTEYEQTFTVAPERKKKSDVIEVKTEKIEESITKAAGEVAQAIGGDVKQTEAELLSKVLGKINQNTTTLSDLLIGMKVDRTKEKDDLVRTETRGQQVKRLADKSRSDLQTTTRYMKRKSQMDEARTRKSLPQAMTVDIFSGGPMGIFKAQDTSAPCYGTKLDVWEQLQQRELVLATSQPPANYFQKMILWTEQGKVWRFPIDNEQGMEEENNVHFSEHIFLDTHLEDWCPKKGPIRHFMELVCVGLSKNPFYTVQEKKDHIMWYKEYFEAKKDLLTEVGAWGNMKPSEEAST